MEKYNAGSFAGLSFRETTAIISGSQLIGIFNNVAIPQSSISDHQNHCAGSIPPLSALGAYVFGKALVAFLVLPGVVAGVLPAIFLLFDPRRAGGLPLGYGVIALGSALLLWCVRDFYVAGKGTLAPWCPPQNLVIVGMYRFLRNPMYVSVLLILVGWCVVSGSNFLIFYTTAVAVMFHLRVILHEEPWLAQEFGQDWSVYSANVRRWFPRLQPWLPADPNT